LSTITLEWPAAQATMLDAQGAIDALGHRRDALGHRRDALAREITALVPNSPWASRSRGCVACVASTR
jgi:hypothetical protein